MPHYPDGRNQHIASKYQVSNKLFKRIELDLERLLCEIEEKRFIVIRVKVLMRKRNRIIWNEI